MRESASPSEGVEGLVEMEMRLYGGLAAVVYLRTFGRCAENAGKCLTFGRCEEHDGDGNAATGVLGAVPHLRTFGR